MKGLNVGSDSSGVSSNSFTAASYPSLRTFQFLCAKRSGRGSLEKSSSWPSAILEERIRRSVENLWDSFRCANPRRPGLSVNISCIIRQTSQEKYRRHLSRKDKLMYASVGSYREVTIG